MTVNFTYPSFKTNVHIALLLGFNRIEVSVQQPCDFSTLKRKVLQQKNIIELMPEIIPSDYH